MKTKRVLIRVTPENLRWLQQYRKALNFPASFALLANLAMEKGKSLMPDPFPKTK